MRILPEYPPLLVRSRDHLHAWPENVEQYVSKINCSKEGRHSIDVVVIIIVIRHCTIVFQINVHPQKYAHPPFSLQVIAKGHSLLKSTPTQQTKTTGSNMHNNEICSVCVG